MSLSRNIDDDPLLFELKYIEKQSNDTNPCRFRITKCHDKLHQARLQYNMSVNKLETKIINSNLSAQNHANTLTDEINQLQTPKMALTNEVLEYMKNYQTTKEHLENVTSLYQTQKMALTNQVLEYMRNYQMTKEHLENVTFLYQSQKNIFSEYVNNATHKIQDLIHKNARCYN